MLWLLSLSTRRDQSRHQNVDGPLIFLNFSKEMAIPAQLACELRFVCVVMRTVTPTVPASFLNLSLEMPDRWRTGSPIIDR